MTTQYDISNKYIFFYTNLYFLFLFTINNMFLICLYNNLNTEIINLKLRLDKIKDMNKLNNINNQSDSSSGIVTGTDSETESETDSETESETDSETESETDSDSEKEDIVFINENFNTKKESESFFNSFLSNNSTIKWNYKYK